MQIFRLKELSKTRILTECAVLAALSLALSLIPGLSMPFGGTISWFATAPVLIAAMRHGSRWGIATALIYSLTQLLLGLNNFSWLPRTLIAVVGCALLDYVIAYTCLGLAGWIYRLCKSRIGGVTVSVLMTGCIRLLCSFLSGILIWKGIVPPEYADWSPWLYSLAYNAAWCVPDVVLALIALLALSRMDTLALLPEKAGEKADA